MNKGIFGSCRAWCGTYHISLKIYCSPSHWHIARLPANFAERFWAMQVNTRTLCNAKAGTGKHGTPISHVQKIEERIPLHQQCRSTSLVLPNDIKRCVSENKKKYVLDWHVVPRIWPMKIGTNLSRQEISALEDVEFQLQRKEVFSPRCRLLTIAMLPIPRIDFHVLTSKLTNQCAAI